MTSRGFVPNLRVLAAGLCNVLTFPNTSPEISDGKICSVRGKTLIPLPKRLHLFAFPTGQDLSLF
jgi:hypothetical protein